MRNQACKKCGQVGRCQLAELIVRAAVFCAPVLSVGNSVEPARLGCRVAVSLDEIS